MSKIEDLNLQNDIFDLVSQGHSARSIARIFKKRGVKIHHSTISRWINSNQELLNIMSQRDDKMKERVVNTFLDASQQILFMNTATLKIFNESEVDNDRTSMFRALDQMGKNLLLYNQLIGKPESEMDMVRILERLPAEYQEAIKNVHRRRNGSSH